MDSARPPTEWKDYVTRRPHGDKPAGSKCQVRRNEKGLLQVRYWDGVEITLGANWYASGPEQAPPEAAWMEPMTDYLANKYDIPHEKVVDLFGQFTAVLPKYKGAPVQAIIMNDVLYHFDDEYSPDNGWVLERKPTDVFVDLAYRVVGAAVNLKQDGEE